MSSNLATVAAVAAAAGVFLHLTWFMRGEHLILAPKYFTIGACGPTLLTTGLVYYLKFSVLQASLTVATGCVSWFIGLWTSILIYRRFFHPLRSFPGPDRAIYTAWWHVSNVIDKFDNFRHLDRLHAQYGDYVRVAPNCLSVADPDWVEPIHNSHSQWSKSDWYSEFSPPDMLLPLRLYLLSRSYDQNSSSQIS